VSELVDS